MSFRWLGDMYLCVVYHYSQTLVLQTPVLTDRNTVHRHKKLKPKQRNQNKRGFDSFPKLEIQYRSVYQLRN